MSVHITKKTSNNLQLQINLLLQICVYKLGQPNHKISIAFPQTLDIINMIMIIFKSCETTGLLLINLERSTKQKHLKEGSGQISTNPRNIDRFSQIT